MLSPDLFSPSPDAPPPLLLAHRREPLSKPEKCIGHGCQVLLLRFRSRVCHRCLEAAANELASEFHRGTLTCDLDHAEYCSHMAGIAGVMPIDWYQRVTKLGQLTMHEALELQELTDKRCLQIAEANSGGLRIHMVPESQAQNLPHEEQERPQVGAILWGFAGFVGLILFVWLVLL